MPAAVVGLALVGGGAITAATLGYVALGVTVAGMVTKNKTLLKIEEHFAISRKILAADCLYLETSSWDDERYRKLCEAFESVDGTETTHIMTKNECLAFEAGWELFGRMLFCLWD